MFRNTDCTSSQSELVGENVRIFKVAGLYIYERLKVNTIRTFVHSIMLVPQKNSSSDAQQISAKCVSWLK